VAHPSESEIRKYQARAAVNLNSDLGRTDVPSARVIYEELVGLAKAHPNESELRLAHAMAASNLVIDHTPDDKAHPDDDDLSFAFAKTTFDLIDSLATTDVAEAQALYRELKALAEADPNDGEIRARQMKAAACLVNGLRSNDMMGARI